MMKVSYIIPCYNSENTIEDVVYHIVEVMHELCTYDYEVILIDDDSPDNVYSIISKMQKRNSKIIGIKFAKNYGQHAAIMAGLRKAVGEIIICLDDDGQTSPKESIKLIHEIEAGADVVYAKYVCKKHSKFRNWGSYLNGKMAEYLLGKPSDLFLSSYFAMRRFVLDEIVKYNNPYPYLMGLVLRTTRNIVNVEVIHEERAEGKSGYTLRKLVSLWLNGFTAFSVKPLRLAALLGAFSAVAGFIYAIFLFINKFINGSVPIGWTSIIVIILIIGGVILFVLGLIGEYIGRIYISLNNAPQYVVRESTVNTQI